MPDAVIHPTPQELTAFGLGKLPERAAAVVAAHLESCAACRQAVAGVSADSFLNKVRDAKQDKTLLPSSSANPQNAPSSTDRPAIPVVPCPNVPPELASHPKYLILRELGRGGMGVVYQARQTMMNRQVVIKVVNRSLLDRPDSLERFRREVQAAAQLSHRNIVTAYDAEQAGELHMLVMEFVPGQSLAEVLEKKGPLPVAHACHYMRQVALGLQHAHERGMVHRDIKPQNLMLMPNGQIKILDFGLAKVASERSASKGLTSSDACMGTPEYIAPEQAEDARAADIRADLYSLGCTLYCLLAGRPPFREDTWMKTVLAHLQKTPQPLTELCPDVPERLWRVVARLMAKDPAKRYQKPIEVVQALAPFVKSGSKQEAKGGAALPQSTDSPAKGTVFELETSEVKQNAHDVPAKETPKRVPVKKEAASRFPNRTDAVAETDKVETDWDEEGPLWAAWWKRPGVLAGAISVSLVLTIMVVLIALAPKVDKDKPTKPPPETPVTQSPESPGKPNAIKPSHPAETKKSVVLSDEAKVTSAKKPPSPPEGSGTPTGASPPERPKTPPPISEVMAKRSIDEAIAAGVKALRRMQQADGIWPHQYIGATALAGLTLLECGADKQDRDVLRAADAVRKASIELRHTYSISLSVLFLDRLGDHKDVPLIKSLTERLLAGQDAKSGGWSDGCPPISAADNHPLPIVGPGDNSNTQFAALALWVGHRHRIPIDRALTRLVQRFRTMQLDDGGWPYSQQTVGSTPTMTCAGLFCLAVGSTAPAKYLNKMHENWTDFYERKGKGLKILSAVLGNTPVEKLQLEEQRKSEQAGGRTYYFLWALESMAVALDLKKIGEKDWHEWGAGILLALQKPDGSWQGEYASCSADTCFALLYLKRSNLTTDLTALLQQTNRNGRWSIKWGNRDHAGYVAGLQGLGAILAIAVNKHGDGGFDYKIVRNLSARPARLLKEDIQKFQQEVQGRLPWMDHNPESVVSVLSVLGLNPPNIKREDLHFFAYFAEKVEQKLSRLEMDFSKRHHPGRKEDDIFVTTFRIKVNNGEYEPEVESQKPK